MLINGKNFLWQAAASVLIVAGATIFGSRIFPVNATTAGFLYLIAVLGIATAWGLATAVVAAVSAMVCFNYFFLPPIGQLTIADPQNWVALSAFLVTALVASHLSDRARKQTREAMRRQVETERLYSLSRAILLADPAHPLGAQAAQQIGEIFDCRGVALFDAKTGETFRGGVEDLPGIEEKLRESVRRAERMDDAPGQTIVAPINLGGPPIGSLAIKGAPLSDGAMRALLNLVAIALERVRAQEAASVAEAARQSEDLKSTLLDAIAHEFKTPLTSIKAASTSILSEHNLAPQVRELETIIDEEADRMNALVTEAVRMSQIDAGKMRLERAAIDVAELLQRVVAQFVARAEGRELSLRTAADVPRIYADAELISLALRQLIDNSLKYSPPGSPVHVIAEAEDGLVSIRVRDRGPGIPERDRERVFQKFFRRAKSAVPGSGVGLYIARAIVRTHGGDIRIEPTGEPGCEFRVLLPAEQPVVAANGRARV